MSNKDKLIAKHYQSGLNISETAAAAGATEREVKESIRRQGIARTRAESAAMAKRIGKKALSHLDIVEQKEAAPYFLAHSLFRRSTLPLPGGNESINR